MSLYKNYFRFILDDSITGRTRLNERTSAYKNFFEGYLTEEDVPSALELGYVAKPYTTPTEYVKAGQEKNADAIRYTRNPNSPTQFDPIGSTGPTAPTKKIAKPAAQAPKSRDDIIRYISSLVKSSEVFKGEVPVGLEGEKIGFADDGTGDRMLELGGLKVKRIAGLEALKRGPRDGPLTSEEIRSSEYYKAEKKKLAFKNPSYDEADLIKETDTNVQSAIAANTVFDILTSHYFTDKETGKFNGVVKTLTPLGTSAVDMASSLKNAFINLRKEARRLVGQSEFVADDHPSVEAFNTLDAAIDEYATRQPSIESNEGEKLRNKVWVSALAALRAIHKGGDKEDTISLNVRATLAETFADFFTVASSKETGFHIIPKSLSVPGVDSITIYKNSPNARGLRLDTVTIDAGQIKWDGGSSTDNNVKQKLTICGPVLVPPLGENAPSEILFGVDIKADCERALHISNNVYAVPSREALPDPVSGAEKWYAFANRTFTGKKPNTPAEIEARQQELEDNVERVAAVFAKKTAKELQEVNDLFEKNAPVVLQHIGFKPEMISDLYKSPQKLTSVLEQVKGIVTLGDMPILYPDKVTSRTIEDSTGNTVTIRDYSNAIGKNVKEESIPVSQICVARDRRFNDLAASTAKLSVLSTYLGCALMGERHSEFRAFYVTMFSLTDVKIADGGVNIASGEHSTVARSVPALRGNGAPRIPESEMMGANFDTSYRAKMFSRFAGGNMGSRYLVQDDDYKKMEWEEMKKRVLHKITEMFNKFKRWG